MLVVLTALPSESGSWVVAAVALAERRGALRGGLRNMNDYGKVLNSG